MPEDSINYMDVHEFINEGFLQEINRLVLHPAGVALQVEIPEEDGDPHSFKVKIWDYRSDPEGIVFADGTISQDKINKVTHAWVEHSPARIEKLGQYIQKADVIEENAEESNE